VLTVSATGIGSDLAGKAAGGRKLIAVAYADMVGYSRLIGLDDAGTLGRLRTLRRALFDPTIREHGGRVVTTGGDSLLIAFDSIDGAVRCAVRVQQQVPVYDGDQPPDRRIRFRIGINIGDVIPHGTDVNGDVVNVAARLEAACPVGGICVTRTVRDHMRDRLELPFEAVGPLTLKNIARPVEAYVVRLDPVAEAPASHAATDAARPGSWVRSHAALLAGVAALLFVAAAGTGLWLYRETSTVPGATEGKPTSAAATAQAFTPADVGLSKAPRLSIVVLPFGNLSGDPKDDYLAEGITEDVTTDLSRISGMFVIARESAYTYRGKAVDVRKVGEELGVRYVLEGSVRKLGDALRVNAQLIGTETGAHLWADRFDQQRKELSEGQDEIVRRIGQTLNVALTDIESARSRRERPTNPDAFDLILRAQSIGVHPMGPREHAERMVLFEQALGLDPGSVLAMTGLAVELIRSTRVYNAGDELDRAAQLIADAAAINPDNLWVLDATAYLLFARSRYKEAISAYQRLLDEYPNSHSAYYQIGTCLVFIGRADDAIPMIETAIQRDPRSPSNASRYEFLALALLLLGRNDDAIVWMQRALAANPNLDAPGRASLNLRIAAAHAGLGRSHQARLALAEANRIWPYDTVRTHAPDDPSDRKWALLVESYQDALRLARHRDHAEEDADFGVGSDDRLHADLAGLTPTAMPGATTISTVDLQRLLVERKPIVIDPMLYWWGRSIPGAVALKRAGLGSSTSDAMQDRLRRKMLTLTRGDLATPVVAIGFNSERFDGRNLALRLVSLGYTNVYWYRGGREAWEVKGLPETEADVQDW
jgi:adenylate cyclase